jgi:hypothetical protein
MVYTTYLWCFWGWFIIALTTLSQLGSIIIIRNRDYHQSKGTETLF